MMSFYLPPVFPRHARRLPTSLSIALIFSLISFSLFVLFIEPPPNPISGNQPTQPTVQPPEDDPEQKTNIDTTIAVLDTSLIKYLVITVVLLTVYAVQKTLVHLINHVAVVNQTYKALFTHEYVYITAAPIILQQPERVRQAAPAVPRMSVINPDLAIDPHVPAAYHPVIVDDSRYLPNRVGDLVLARQETQVMTHHIFRPTTFARRYLFTLVKSVIIEEDVFTTVDQSVVHTALQKLMSAPSISFEALFAALTRNAHINNSNLDEIHESIMYAKKLQLQKYANAEHLISVNILRRFCAWLVFGRTAPTWYIDTKFLTQWFLGN
jgi:hypothetical protein